MQILVTNDDGIYSEGILAIVNAIQKLGDICVVAPDSERSSVSHGITLNHPIQSSRVHRREKFFGYSLTGTPADCVKFGMKVLLKTRPDLVIAGINHGLNDGCSVFYSGTVAGAREGVLMGVPAVAFSLESTEQITFEQTAKMCARILKKLKPWQTKTSALWNINIPDRPVDQLKGPLITRQGLRPIQARFNKRLSPNNKTYYWMSGQLPRQRQSLTFDSDAIIQGYVTMTPIHCDMTDLSLYDQVKNQKDKISDLG